MHAHASVGRGIRAKMRTDWKSVLWRDYKRKICARETGSSGGRPLKRLRSPCGTGRERTRETSSAGIHATSVVVVWPVLRTTGNWASRTTCMSQWQGVRCATGLSPWGGGAGRLQWGQQTCWGVVGLLLAAIAQHVSGCPDSQLTWQARSGQWQSRRGAAPSTVRQHMPTATNLRPMEPPQIMEASIQNLSYGCEPGRAI
jgi:hypothetical protein